MKVVFSLMLAGMLLVPALFASDAPDKYAYPRIESVVQSGLQKAILKAGPDGIAKVWVFFADKGFSTLSEYQTQLEDAQSNLTKRALARRIKARGITNAVDFCDIPVPQSYIDKVLATGAKQREILRWFNAVTVEATPDQLTKIAAMPFVSNIKHIAAATIPSDDVKLGNQTYQAPLTATTLDYGDSRAQLEQINVTVAHELGFAAESVLVCMMDAGYRVGHQAFQPAINSGRLIAQYDFVFHDNNTDYDPNQDVEGQPNHGTLTWSTLGGQVPGQLYGPAYAASFCLAKTEDIASERHIEEDNWAAGAQWADSLGADVISASLGYRFEFTPPDQDYTYADMNGDSTIVTRAADLAVHNGITVVTANGNDGYQGAGSLIAPADGDSVISCGAVDEFSGIAGFSALGPTYDGRIKPEVCARGVGTACADPYNMTGYTTASGTSLSTPLCGGAAAVLLSVHPNWTPTMVREALMMTATQNSNPDNTYGWGIIDVGRAMFYNPTGNIVIDHEPLFTFTTSENHIDISATVSGGTGINSSACYVYSRETGSQSFIQTAMATSDNLHFTGEAPMPDTGGLEYYIFATDVNTVSATYPYGAPSRYFSVRPFASQFIDSFENGPYYWKSSGTNGGWSVTAETSATGNISVTDSPYGSYRNNTLSFLTSNFKLDLSQADSASCRIKAKYNLQANRDKVFFEVSTDGGSQWTAVGQPISGISSAFTEINYSLASYLGNSDVRIRFRLTTDASIVRDGIFIDDIQLAWHNNVGIAGNDLGKPERYSLAQNYPNPFNSNTEIKFTLPKTSPIEINIYDIAGRKVKMLISGMLESGTRNIIWDGRNDSGEEVSSGVYYYRLKTNDGVLVKKMTLLR